LLGISESEVGIFIVPEKQARLAFGLVWFRD
jgi:hypothetical protein